MVLKNGSLKYQVLCKESLHSCGKVFKHLLKTPQALNLLYLSTELVLYEAVYSYIWNIL